MRPFSSFTPCEGCKGAEAIEDAGTLVRADFGKAATMAGKMCTPQMTTHPEQMDALVAPIARKYELDGYEDALTACVAQQALNLCGRLQPQNQEVVISELL